MLLYFFINFVRFYAHSFSERRRVIVVTTNIIWNRGSWMISLHKFAYVAGIHQFIPVHFKSQTWSLNFVKSSGFCYLQNLLYTQKCRLEYECTSLCIFLTFTPIYYELYIVLVVISLCILFCFVLFVKRMFCALREVWLCFLLDEYCNKWP